MYNKETLLAINTYEFNIPGLENASGNAITSPFLIGQEKSKEAAKGYSHWNRGAYQTAKVEPSIEELPTKVVMTYKLDGEFYKSKETKINFSEEDI